MKTKFINNFYTLGKYLDQPAIINGLNRYVTIVSAGAAAAYTAYDTYKAPVENKKKIALRDILVLSGSLLSAFAATRGVKINGKQFIKGLAHDLDEKSHHHKHNHFEPIDEVLDFVKKNNKPRLAAYIKKIKNKQHISLKRFDRLNKGLKKLSPDENLMGKVIPDNHVHTPREMFTELLYLTKIGAVPVVGGVVGGVAADKINGENITKTSKNKIKEGFYQYLANIALCNAGAGSALYLMNKLNINSKAGRFIGMLAGVVSVGILFGGTIANFIGKNLINPLVDNGVKETFNRARHHRHGMFKNINSERKPELLDLGLHIDDIASVGFLSGIKWIGPILPALYSVSGYRAGIGYRNGKPHEDENAINASISLNQVDRHYKGRMREIYEQFQCRNNFEKKC